MREFHTTSLADQVFDKLENDIITGVYPKGEILTELKLVEQLGVSRTPIREALRRLEQERLIAESGKGSVVLGITEEDLEDIMNIREHIEGLASYYAAVNMTPDGLKELEHIMDLQEFYFSKHDLEHMRQIDDKFHDLICQLSKRTVINDTLVPLHRKTQRYRKKSMENDQRLVNMIAEHRNIFNAIAAGDAALAESLTAQHIRNAKLNMLERLKNNG
ncbi:MAG: GntR family transcriptional regulator [Oscillospiraceae bacterium]|nr:GntR family transcriptional regulator [Oscillospiraceae bacterium]